MKKVVALAVAGALALTLVGCSSGAEESSGVSGTSQEVEQSTTVESQSTSSGADDLSKQSQDALDYMGRPELKNMEQVAQLSLDQLDAYTAGDVARVSEINAQIEALCNEVIDMQDIPEIVKRSHDYLIESATCYRESSNYIAMAANSGDLATANEYLEDANEMASQAGQNARLAGNAVEDITRQLT